MAISIDPVTKQLQMDEEEYTTITNHIKDCEEQIKLLWNRIAYLEMHVQRKNGSGE